MSQTSFLDKYGPGIAHLAFRDLKRSFTENIPVRVIDTHDNTYETYIQGDKESAVAACGRVIDLHKKGMIDDGKYVQWMYIAEDEGIELESSEIQKMRNIESRLVSRF